MGAQSDGTGRKKGVVRIGRNGRGYSERKLYHGELNHVSTIPTPTITGRETGTYITN